MSRKILGLDLGTNSIGWALIEAEDGKLVRFLDSGVRIFIRAVKGRKSTPKSAARRQSRLARRVLQRRARRKRRLLGFLVKLDLLPAKLAGRSQPETILNGLGNPYTLRAKALDEPLSQHELGRVLLHLVQRRGFLSNRKTTLGDMVDDPDVQSVLEELEGEEDTSSERAKEENAFKKDISQLRDEITVSGYRTLGEYLSKKSLHELKRNRAHDGGHLRTDRQMYREELAAIFASQTPHHDVLTEEVKREIEEIIFKQRPLRLRSDRVGKCSLEKNNSRAKMARLEYQRFRYLQDINHLQYRNTSADAYVSLSKKDREKLVELFESKGAIDFPQIRATLGLDKKAEFNLDYGTKELMGNITATTIRGVWEDWDTLDDEKQHALVEDLITINKKSVLKARLMKHWGLDASDAVNLAVLEFEPGHANLSLKAINKLLPFLANGEIYADAKVSAGYESEAQEGELTEKLGPHPELPNPIVKRGLSELRRLVNALIKEHGKPDAIRIEMARDLEMNTERYRQYLEQQKANTAANEEAAEEFKSIGAANPHLGLSAYPSRADKIRYRLWKDQSHVCAYSGNTINLTQLFSDAVEVDHILPLSRSLDDSYMNKVVCLTAENRAKGQRTPVDAFSVDEDKWEQIRSRIHGWDKKLGSKRNRFFMKDADIDKQGFINSQLTDTRYIAREALKYLATLGCDVSTSKGITTSWLRHQWDLNSLLGASSLKERTDHRHHLIDAAVVACVDRSFYQTLVGLAKSLERTRSDLTMNDLHTDPPWDSFREDLRSQLDSVIVSHQPQRKLAGALHEDTGAGFIEGVGNVNRRPLNPDFKPKQVAKIIDPAVQECVRVHLAAHGDDPKTAFAPGQTVFHKDGSTPIKRVRVRQSETTLARLQRTKFGARDQNGRVFKWLPYGNYHHVEVLRHRRTGKSRGIFVTMMEAAHRIQGIDGPKRSAVKKDHGADEEFIMALYKNDLIGLRVDGEDRFYRVQKLEGLDNRLKLRIHTASTDKNIEETLPPRESSITALMSTGMIKVRINSIGRVIP